MKILVVEDNEHMRRVIRTVVGDLADVKECSDGADALSAYRLHEPDLVLMDIKMSRTSGINATRQITSAFPDARVVMVTNFDDVESREAARSAGACDYVLKEDLLSLRQIIQESRRDDGT